MSKDFLNSMAYVHIKSKQGAWEGLQTANHVGEVFN